MDRLLLLLMGLGVCVGMGVWEERMRICGFK